MYSRKIRYSMLVAGCLLVIGLAIESGNTQSAQVAYPEGYRDWSHMKSMVLKPGHSLYEAFGGIHHIYVNNMGEKAMKDGKPFPDGTVLILDLLEAVEADNAIVEGSRKVVGVMEKNSARFSATGGWGFEGFKGDTRERVVTDATTQCFACHTSQEKSDYVFTRYRP